MKLEWNRLTTAAAAGGMVFLLSNIQHIGDGADYLRKLLGTTQTAYAAMDKADKVESEFDLYLRQQREAQQLEQQRVELQQQFNEQLLAIQQQTRPGLREWDDSGCWDCPTTDRAECDARRLWVRCP